MILGIQRCNPAIKYAIFMLNLEPLNNNMRNLILLLAFSVCGLLAEAQVLAPAPADQLQLKETEHDFKMIPQGRPVFYQFVISNTGTSPLKLDDVHASCGCTTPEWSREAIAPGASGQIKVGFNAAAAGPFEKYITITYNGTQSKQLKITGNVWKAPEGSAPANASIDLLKKQTF